MQRQEFLSFYHVKKYSIPAFPARINECLDVFGVSVEEMIGRAADISRMILCRLKTFEDLASCAFRSSAFEAGVLIESADKEQFVSDTMRSFFQIAVSGSSIPSRIACSVSNRMQKLCQGLPCPGLNGWERMTPRSPSLSLAFLIWLKSIPIGTG